MNMSDAVKCDVCNKDNNKEKDNLIKGFSFCKKCADDFESRKQFTRMVVKDNGRKD